MGEKEEGEEEEVEAQEEEAFACVRLGLQWAGRAAGAERAAVKSGQPALPHHTAQKLPPLIMARQIKHQP